MQDIEVTKDDNATTPVAGVVKPKVPEISQEERLLKSEQYKNEGNDAFKAGDYNKAILLYSQALGK